MKQIVKKEEAGAEVVAMSESASVMEIISRAASDPNVDIDKMERLLAMRERMLDREAEQAFNESMRAAQQEMPQVVRDAKNEQTRSRYARYETISRKMAPVITKHGFSLSFGTADSPLKDHYRITCKASHVAGHSRDYFADVPSDMVGMKGNQNKTATHGFGSTMSYGRRYLKTLIFDVAVTNEDDDGGSAALVEPISAKQKDELIELIKETGTDTAKFCQFMCVDALDDLRTTHFDSAKSALLKKKGAPK
jgi:hypothetical protein